MGTVSVIYMARSSLWSVNANVAGFRADGQDRWDGLLPRWHVNFNITMLRIVSFVLDHHWRHTGESQTVSLVLSSVMDDFDPSHRKIIASVFRPAYQRTNTQCSTFSHTVYTHPCTSQGPS